MSFDQISVKNEDALLKVLLFHLREAFYIEAAEGAIPRYAEIKAEVISILKNYYKLTELETLSEDLKDFAKLVCEAIYSEVNKEHLPARAYIEPIGAAIDDDYRPIYLDNRSNDYLNNDYSDDLLDFEQ